MGKKLQHEYDTRSARIRKVLEHDHFFICGAPKSGTTWIQRLLDSHPEIVCAGEGHFVEAMVAPLARLAQEYNKRQKLSAERVYEGKPYYQGLQQPDLEFLSRTMIGLILSQRKIPEGTKCIGDKTPRYTFRMNVLARLFPQSKFIHVIRDGRDVITSTCHHAFRAGQRAVVDKTRPEYFSYTAQMAAVWVKNGQAARNFGKKFPRRYRMIKYEDMHAQPETTLDSLLQFLDVKNDMAVIKDCISQNEFKKLSGGRDVGEEDKNSYFRKGAPGDWKNFLSNSALKGVYQQAAPLLKELGYLQDAEIEAVRSLMRKQA